MADITLEPAGVGRYALRGVLSYATTPQVWTQGAALFGEADAVVLDLEGVMRADSAGLALLVEWMRVARARGKTISYAGVPAQLLSLAHVCGLGDILPLVSQPA